MYKRQLQNRLPERVFYNDLIEHGIELSVQNKPGSVIDEDYQVDVYKRQYKNILISRQPKYMTGSKSIIPITTERRGHLDDT